jgi:CelD/BcsL family acetyltransferase involved in cellulose biosynthesis
MPCFPVGRTEFIPFEERIEVRSTAIAPGGEMPDYECRCIQSVDQLRAAAGHWDDLWRRSDVAVPTARAELLAQWLERFAPGKRLRAVTVADGGRLIAALPLVSGRLKRLLPVGVQPSNSWTPCGELLVDPQCDVPRAIESFLRQLNRLRWPLIWLDAVCAESSRWQAFLGGLDRAAMAYDVHRHYPIGRIAIGADWDVYEASWSKNHRSHMRKALRRVEREGGVELRVLSRLRPEEVEFVLRQCFEIEDQSWKGAAGSSILRTPGMPEFYCRQARQLADWGQVEINLLEHRGAPIAFHYAWVAKGVYHPFKVGYDAAFSAWTPGQLLWRLLLERFHSNGDVRLVDLVGPLTDATGKWATETYYEDRLVIAPRRPGSRALLRGYQTLAAAARRWRERRRRRVEQMGAPAEPGAAEPRECEAPVG